MPRGEAESENVVNKETVFIEEFELVTFVNSLDKEFVEFETLSSK